MNNSNQLWFNISLWLLFLLIILFVRPLTPIDETRYLSVAWEMYLNGDYLIPHKNGELYTDKPPLYFWLVNIVWAIFGVNEFIARLVAPFFALLSLVFTYLIAKQLFPNKTQIACNSTWVLTASVFWAFSSTIAKMDMLVVFFTLLGVWSLLAIWLYEKQKMWFVFSLALALGGLAKGPVILLHLLPLAIFIPFIFKIKKNNRWYLPLLLSTILGVGLAFLWAVPAAIYGGEQYANAIFLKQSLERISSIDKPFVNIHSMPFWWYLPMLLLSLFPFSFKFNFYKFSIKNIINYKKPEVVFLFVWFLLPFILFSFIKGKQMFYLLPEFPALAILTSILVNNNKVYYSKNYLMAFVIFTITILFIISPYLGAYYDLPIWIDNLNIFGIMLLLIIFASYFVKFKNNIYLFTVTSFGLLIAIHLIFISVLNKDYDVGPMAQLIYEKQSQGHKIAHTVNYHSQFQFSGRLEEPLIIVKRKDQALKWAKDNKNGFLVVYRNPKIKLDKDYKINNNSYPYAGEEVVLWSAKAIIAHPDLLDWE